MIVKNGTWSEYFEIFLFFLPVSRIYQLWSQAQFFQRLIANYYDDGGGRGWNDARRQSFGQSPVALLFDQLPERLNDWGPPFNLNTQSGNVLGLIALIVHLLIKEKWKVTR